MARPHSARLILLGGTALFAGLALVSGLDRAAAQHPAMAQWVPAPFKAAAWRADAETELRAGTPARSEQSARRAIAADPVDPRSVALLGGAQLAQGQRGPADRSFRVSAQFGWRDPLTQIYLMDVALKAGEPRLAALRLDAVLRQAPGLPVRDMLIAQFTTDPRRRAALGERLALRPAWTDTFVRQVAHLPLPELAIRAEMVRKLANPAWGCDQVAPLADRLVAAGGISEAKQLWLAHCPHAAAGVADPQFTARLQGRGPIPFEWNFPGSGDIATAQASIMDPGRSGLLARVSGPSPLAVAWQMLSIPPGRYRLTWIAQAADGQPARGAELSVACNPAIRRGIKGVPVPGSPARFAAIVPVGGDCKGHFLTLWLDPAAEEVRFDNVTITPL